MYHEDLNKYYMEKIVVGESNSATLFTGQYNRKKSYVVPVHSRGGR